MRFNVYVLVILIIGCNVDYFKTVGIANDSSRKDDIADIVQSILGNDTVLNSLLQRYPEFFSVVARIVNETTSKNTTTAIDEAFICNIASSAINDSKDTCLTPTNNLIDSCFKKPNATETANASLFQLCGNTTGTVNSPSTPSTISKYTKVVADTTFASSMLSTILPAHSTTEEIVTSNTLMTESRKESTVAPSIISTKSLQNEWKNLSSTLPKPSPTSVPTTVALVTNTDTLPPATAGPPVTTVPVIGIAPPAATLPPMIPVWFLQQSLAEVTSSYLFLAVKLAVKTAMISFERKCKMRNGIYVKESQLCIISYKAGHNGTRNYTIVPESNSNRIDVKKLRILHIAGNSGSIVAILFLFTEYFIGKSQFSLFDKSILSLALCLLMSHLMQLLIAFLSWNNKFCKAGGILLHWALLSSFAWMTVISLDIFNTFRRMQRKDNRSSKKYRRYLISATAVSTTVILTCIFLGIPESDYSGYGYQGRCFIGKMWANLFSFTLPVAISLLLNTALMIATLIRIYTLQRRSAKAFSGGRGHSSSSRKKVVISILTLKLSILFGIGWTIGFVDSITTTSISTFIFTGIVSLQGLFIFICFGCHKSFLNKCRKRLFRKVGSPMLQKKTKGGHETETTYL